jgi:hypothetical protein
MSDDAHLSTDGSPAAEQLVSVDWDAIDIRVVPAIRSVTQASLRNRLARFARRHTPAYDAPRRAQYIDRKSLGAGE